MMTGPRSRCQALRNARRRPARTRARSLLARGPKRAGTAAATIRPPAPSVAARLGGCRSTYGAAKAPAPYVDAGSADRDDAAEQTVALVVRTRGEEEGVRRTGGSVVAERERPQAVDRDEVAPGETQSRAEDERLAALSRRLEREDPTITEVADQEVTRVPAEPLGRHREAPRSVQPSAAADAAQERTVRVEHVHEAETRPCDLVARGRVLLRVRHEHRPAELRDAERREAVGQRWVDERSSRRHEVE